MKINGKNMIDRTPAEGDEKPKQLSFDFVEKTCEELNHHLQTSKLNHNIGECEKPKFIIEKSAVSVLDPIEKRLLDLSLGRVEAETEEEKRMVAQMKEAEKKGYMVVIPSM